MKWFFYSFILIMGLIACQNKTSRAPSLNAAFRKTSQNSQGSYDLENIKQGGELVIGTLSGPENYFEYHNMEFGLQYGLIENFAQKEGVNIRIEIAADTTTLLQLLKDGNVDLLAIPLPIRLIRQHRQIATGATQSNGQKSWAVRNNMPLLAKALQKWYTPSLDKTISEEQTARLLQVRRPIKRTKIAFLSKSRGVISIYDDLFKQAALTTGWDWRLIAAQCYQESGFDPNALSWAGAQGLMQLMPKTAQSLGVNLNEIKHPATNIAAAAQLIVQLNQSFSDIKDKNERIKFILAAYNGGTGHIRDAMSLAKKYQKGERLSWNVVSNYILALQNIQYYRDPVVKYGYMIGSETTNYVQRVLERFQSYGGSLPNSFIGHSPQEFTSIEPYTSIEKDPSPHTDFKSKSKPNKYSSGIELMHPDDPRFNQMH